MVFGNKSRRERKQNEKPKLKSKGDEAPNTEEDNKGVAAEMAGMEKEFTKEEGGGEKSLYVSAASTSDTSLSTSRVLNLQSNTGFALVVYIHEAADLDPAAGTGQAIVEITYKKQNKKTTTTTTTMRTPKETEMQVLSDGAADGDDRSPLPEPPQEASMMSMSLVRPLEKFSSKIQTLTSDLSHQLNMPGGETTTISFATPPSNIHNGFASWGATSRILKIADLKENCPETPMNLQVKVWQVLGGLGGSTCTLMGTGARVLLGETEWKIDLQDVEIGIHGIHDTELTLSNAWNAEEPYTSSSSRDVDITPTTTTGAANDDGNDVENQMPLRGGFSHVQLHGANMPKINLSWRLESLRGKESDEIEMRISKLPYRGHSYAHGGFMGASLSMMGDGQWREILEHLESKKVFLSCRDAWNSGGDFQKKMKLMPLLENSPILCAYGLVRSRCTEVASDIPDTSGFEQPLSRVSLSPVIRNESDKSSNPLGSKHSHMQASMNMSIHTPMGESGESLGDIGPAMMVREEADTIDRRSGTGGALDTDRSAGGGMTNRNNWSFLLLGATSETRAQMHWKMFAKRLLKIRRRWRFAIKAVIRQCRISMSWEKSQQRSRVNRYGYSPIPLEWDLWVSPTKPWSVAHATVDHGSQAALVQQAIFTTLGLKRCAGLLGSKHINQKGVPPVQWLTMFGEALNLAVNEDKEEPLPFHVDSRLESFYELEVRLISGEGLVAMDITNTSDPYCKVVVKGDTLLRKKEKSQVKFSTLSPQWKEDLKVWPIDPQAENCSLVIEVWDKDTTSGDDFMGKVEIPLDDLELSETSEFYSYPLQPKDGEKSLKSSFGSDLSSSTSNNIGTLTFECKLKEKTVLEAAEEFGIPRHAFQSCLCMLSEPGGIFLDVKSAYSKAKDLALFTTTLTGMGICVKSICSFSPSQLKLPDPCPGVRSQVPVVRFFHGLSGLENACDNGQIQRNDNVFFNGASFLMDTTKGDEGGMVAMARLGALDTMYVNRYQALSETYHFNGGIYVQETDCCATCVEALTALVSQRPDIFPLGFAYGHVPGFSVSSISMRGRGFAAQQIVEEFQARADLSGKVQRSIALGKHKEVSLSVATSWLERLLYGSNFLYIHEQRLVLQMLGDIHLDTNLSKVIAHVGGVERIFLRFFEHYEATTPFTIHETGFNFNKTKTLCRFLRDHGVLERLPLEKKQKLAKFLTSRSVYGFGMTYIFQKAGFRKSLHKFAKEGMLCLLESCSKMEFDKLIDDMGGMGKAVEKFSGRWQISKSYMRRLKVIQDCHDAYPYDPQYIADMTIQRASAVNRSRESRFHKNRSVTFDKKLRRAAKDTALKTRKVVRKSTCCVFTGFYVAALTFFTFSLFAWIYGLPRTLWPYWGKTWNRQRIKGIMIIIGVLLLSAGLTLGVGAIVWFFIFKL